MDEQSVRQRSDPQQEGKTDFFDVTMDDLLRVQVGKALGGLLQLHTQSCELGKYN
jgi:hypothetical protein